MSYVTNAARDTSLDRRVAALELKLHEIERKATSAWEAYQRGVQRKHDFWWATFRYVAMAQLGFAIGLLIFGRR